MIANQLQEVDCSATIIVEPIARNTAPAIAVAAFQALSQGADPLLLVQPADHLIGDQEAFEVALEGGVGACRQRQAGYFWRATIGGGYRLWLYQGCWWVWWINLRGGEDRSVC